VGGLPDQRCGLDCAVHSGGWLVACSGGELQYLGDDNTWGQVPSCINISHEDIDAGKLRFVPSPNESGYGGYGGDGIGNLQLHYAAFTYRGWDGSVASDTVTMTVDVTPVADAPILCLGNPGSNDWTRFADELGNGAGSGHGVTLLTQPSLEDGPSVGYADGSRWLPCLECWGPAG